MELIILMVAIFLSASLLTETLGIWARVQGAFNDEPTTGYSTHVRIATLGRFFILLSAPTLGYLVDSGVNNKQIAIIGILLFFIIFISILLFLKFGIKHFGKLYRFINRRKNIKDIEALLIPIYEVDKQFFIFVFISFTLTGTGVILVNYIATLFPDLRAMIVQMAASVTMFGTLVHVFLIDPKLSQAADKNKKLLMEYIIGFLYGRALSSLILVICFIGLYLYV